MESDCACLHSSVFMILKVNQKNTSIILLLKTSNFSLQKNIQSYLHNC